MINKILEDFDREIEDMETMKRVLNPLIAHRLKLKSIINELLDHTISICGRTEIPYQEEIQDAVKKIYREQIEDIEKKIIETLEGPEEPKNKSSEYQESLKSDLKHIDDAKRILTNKDVYISIETVDNTETCYIIDSAKEEVTKAIFETLEKKEKELEREVF